MSSTCTIVEPYQESEEELYASACDDVEARGSVEEQQKLLSAPAVRSHRILDDVRTAVTFAASAGALWGPVYRSEAKGGRCDTIANHHQHDDPVSSLPATKCPSHCLRHHYPIQIDDECFRLSLRCRQVGALFGVGILDHSIALVPFCGVISLLLRCADAVLCFTNAAGFDGISCSFGRIFLRAGFVVSSHDIPSDPLECNKWDLLPGLHACGLQVS